MKSSKYAKAYSIGQLRKFRGWTEHATDLRADVYVLLHDNFVVTRGLWVDQDIVFAAVTDQWMDFCRQTLGFQATKAGNEHADPMLADRPDAAGARRVRG